MSSLTGAGHGRRLRKQSNAMTVLSSGSGSAPAPRRRSRASNDDDANRQAVMEVIQLWLDRLQLVSVITTFFASTDGLVLGYTTSYAHLGTKDVRTWDTLLQLMNACMIGALIFHTCSAIIAFVASFAMIRYKLHEVTKHDGRPSTFPAPNPNGPPHGDPFPCPYPDDDDDEWGVSAQGQSKKEKATDVGAQSAIDILPTMNELLSTPFQTRVSISRVHPFWFIFPQRTHRNDPSRRPPSDGNDPEGNGDAYGPQPVAELKSPVDLLTKCHTLSVLLAVAGFICALIGILSFVWKALPRSISIFSTAALGSCGILGLIAFY